MKNRTSPKSKEIPTFTPLFAVLVSCQHLACWHLKQNQHLSKPTLRFKVFVLLWTSALDEPWETRLFSTPEKNQESDHRLPLKNPWNLPFRVHCDAHSLFLWKVQSYELWSCHHRSNFINEFGSLELDGWESQATEVKLTLNWFYRQGSSPCFLKQKSNSWTFEGFFLGWTSPQSDTPSAALKALSCKANGWRVDITKPRPRLYLNVAWKDPRWSRQFQTLVVEPTHLKNKSKFSNLQVGDESQKKIETTYLIVRMLE